MGLFGRFDMSQLMKLPLLTGSLPCASVVQLLGFCPMPNSTIHDLTLSVASIVPLRLSTGLVMTSPSCTLTLSCGRGSPPLHSRSGAYTGGSEKPWSSSQLRPSRVPNHL